MKYLKFDEIANLISLSRTTHIDSIPAKGAEKWAIYPGVHRVHASEYPFQVIYLNYRATRADMDAAASAAASGIPLHVVYFDSFGNPSPYLQVRFPDPSTRWSIKQYLRSFIKDELQIYLDRLKSQKPADYTHPRIETPSGSKRRQPNPVWDLLTEADLGAGAEAGALGILLAQPGQGKTYLSRFLVAELADSKRDIIPLMVDSSQWKGMSLDDLSSLGKTIAHTFRHFGAPIGWLDGHEDEFIRVALQADVFRIVFDGFDEYVLRNGGNIQGMDVLNSLTELVTATGSRMVITSRSSFWTSNLPDDEIAEFTARPGTYIYNMLPFDRAHARNYFRRRLDSQRDRERADYLFGQLQKTDAELVGRGFALSLIADLYDDSHHETASPDGQLNALDWITTALCQREVVRQQLPYSDVEQVRILRTFALEVASGADASTDLLDLAMEIVRPDLDEQTRRAVLSKFRSHPLMSYGSVSDRWLFRQEQVKILFLAQCVLESDAGRLASIAERLRLDPGAWQDLGIMVVDLVGGLPDSQRLDALQRIVAGLRSDAAWRPLGLRTTAARLGSIISIVAVDRLLGAGSPHRERTKLLLDILRSDALEQLVVTGQISRFDLSGIEIRNCKFENVVWANCTFDQTTHFVHCVVSGGAPPVRCKGLGLTRWTDEQLDAEAAGMLSAERIREGQRHYSREDLKTDIESVLGKFLTRGGTGLRSIDEHTLRKGTISASKHRDAILAALDSGILRTHAISGTGKKGVHIDPAAEEAMKFYASNNVFTGPIREAFERLRRKLDIE